MLRCCGTTPCAIRLGKLSDTARAFPRSEDPGRWLAVGAGQGPFHVWGSWYCSWPQQIFFPIRVSQPLWKYNCQSNLTCKLFISLLYIMSTWIHQSFCLFFKISLKLAKKNILKESSSMAKAHYEIRELHSVENVMNVWKSNFSKGEEKSYDWIPGLQMAFFSFIKFLYQGRTWEA